MRGTRGWVLGAVAAFLFVVPAVTVVRPVTAGASAPARPFALRRLLLARGDLPRGWKQAPSPKNEVTTHLGCVQKLAHLEKGWQKKEVVFTSGKGLPFVAEGLATGPGVAGTWRAVRSALSRCRSATITINAKTVRARIRRLAFPALATGVVASSWTLVATGIPLGIDVYIFRAHRVLGSVSFTGAGTPDVDNAAAFATAAITKAAGGTGRVHGVVEVAAAPVRVARTADGAVGYRMVGSGPPLVLVMGYGGTMETWAPGFVDALARQFRVVVFDNAGIGRTSALRGPLTIDAMARQTSALITTLHLGSPDVLGWSMGGLVAEALAVLRPAQVHRLVLCATYPGTGAVRPPQSAVDALDAGGSKALGVLFPPSAKRAAAAFGVETSAYPSSAPAPKRVVAAQGKAVLRAWAGKDRALRRFRQIRAPTLVADGARDALVPPRNAPALAAGIPGATLVVYKDAGHAFLFQDAAAFVPAVKAFLSG